MYPCTLDGRVREAPSLSSSFFRAEQTGNNFTCLKDFRDKNGYIQRHNLAWTVLHVPNLLDSGVLEKMQWWGGRGAGGLIYHARGAMSGRNPHCIETDAGAYRSQGIDLEICPNIHF